MHEANGKIYEFDNFRLDVFERQLLKNKRPVAIPPKAFDLLVALVESNGSLIERESLYSRVWPETIVEDANLNVHISTIRKALEEPSCISTVSGHGYRFTWSVREINGGNGGTRTETTGTLTESLTSGEAESLLQPEGNVEPHVHEPEVSTKPVASNRNSLIVGIIGVVLVTALGVASYFYYGSGSVKRIESIAVMPFVNETGNPDLDYLSDGMTISVISSLSKLPDISVKARSSVFRYKGKNTEALTIAKELGVQALLNGRLVQRGNDITLFVELIEPTTEKILWSENYNRSMLNLVTLQGDIARDVSQKLTTKLSSEQQQQLAKVDTTSPEAYQLYLRGRYHWKKREPEDLRKSIDYFSRAIVFDPNYAKAYAGLADAYASHFDYVADSSVETIELGRDAALKALSLNDGSAEAHASLGIIMQQRWDFAGSERELKRAIDLDPEYPEARRWYGQLLRSLGKFEEMFAEYRRAVDLEPLDPFMTDGYASAFSWARRYDEALVQFNISLELDPNRAIPHVWIAYPYWAKGDYAKAVDHLAKARELRGKGEVASKMRKAFADGGWHGFLRASVEDPAILPWPYERARYYATLGEKERAFEQLNKAYEIRESRLRNLKIDPLLDGIRDDPRYGELVRKVGFPE